MHFELIAATCFNYDTLEFQTLYRKKGGGGIFFFMLQAE